MEHRILPAKLVAERAIAAATATGPIFGHPLSAKGASWSKVPSSRSERGRIIEPSRGIERLGRFGNSDGRPDT